MRMKMLALATVGVLATGAITACDSGDDSSSGNSTTAGRPRVGVILPDTKSSPRWGASDPKYLREAFAAAGVPVEVRNAEGDREAFKRIGGELIDGGVKVLIMANIDSDSGRVVIDRARAKNVPVIDYDRLTLGGGADYYVSFDNQQVGNRQAYALSQCLTEKKIKNPVIAALNGSPTDHNATQSKAGSDEFLQPMYDEATYTKGPEQWVTDWDSDEATRIFTQMLEQQPRIQGVLAANDGLAAAVIEVLRAKGLAGKVPVTGQDATLEGLQNLLTGDQCVTIYKPFGPEAKTAANLAVQLFKGTKPTVAGRLKDPESGAYVPYISLVPQTVTRETIKNVVNDGSIAKKQLCVGKYVKLCKEHGIN